MNTLTEESEEQILSKPNAKIWKRGDIVIHELENKKPHMLSHVIAVNGDLVTTQYFIPRLKANNPDGCVNHYRHLYDPSLFGIDLKPLMPLLRELV
ncbi:MAG TPA: hypothetical protein VM680_18455 [Verrucomicrobiae bacterium]|nr:hypothetical protein [Verrucomicrobiae bacterium]